MSLFVVRVNGSRMSGGVTTDIFLTGLLPESLPKLELLDLLPLSLSLEPSLDPKGGLGEYEFTVGLKLDSRSNSVPEAISCLKNLAVMKSESFIPGS